jgi:hypothetical protein
MMPAMTAMRQTIAKTRMTMAKMTKLTKKRAAPAVRLKTVRTLKTG